MIKLFERVVEVMFWSRMFKDVRQVHYHIAYRQGRFDEKYCKQQNR